MPATMLDAFVAYQSQRVIGGGSPPGYAGWGSGGATAPLSTQTGLISAHTETRQPVTLSRITGPSPNLPNDTVQGVVTIQALGAKAVSEVVWFDDPSSTNAANALFRATHGVMTMDSAQEGIQYTLQMQGRIVST